MSTCTTRSSPRFKTSKWMTLFNKSLSKNCNTDMECTNIKERAELADTLVRSKIIEDDDNDIPRKKNAEEKDIDYYVVGGWESNYIIVRTIINELDWRDQLRCALVCRVWRDAVKSLQCENLHCYDFAVQMDAWEHPSIKLHISSLPVQTRPMFAISFYNNYGKKKIRCKGSSPALCNPPCYYEHYIIEAVHKFMLSKRSCLLSVCGPGLIYMPRPLSRTFQCVRQPSAPVLGGLYLPIIPNVNYRTVQYRGEVTVREDVYSIVDYTCSTDIIKGVIVFVKYPFLGIDAEVTGLLNYFKRKQPIEPYAVGGLVVERVNRNTRTEWDVRVTMGVFSVPKEPAPGPRCQFNMYSLVIDSTVEEKPATEKVIQTFAENISELQYSAALMLSCSSRKYTHDFEQELFRSSFPRTTVVGCYGAEDYFSSYNKQIGCNYPEPDIGPPPTKRANSLGDCEPDLMHLDSTVFVYFGWGK